MTDTLIPRADLDFLLYDWLKIETLFAQPRFADHSRDTIDAMLDLSQQVSADLFLPHYKESDIKEPRLDADGVHILPAIAAALREYAELGLFASGFPEELGGYGLPYLAASASFAMVASANIATTAYPMLTTANARLIATFGSPAQIEHFAKPQIAGRWFGTMCLSEPQAGSSLADITTRAVSDGADELGARYSLTGNKMWISGGDQDASENIVHLVLAKIPQADGALPEGSKGISLFIAPKFLPDGARNALAVAGLNHKMGYRGTANCLLNLGETTGATGWLVGEPGHGLAQMFQMMNEARIGVGIGASALGVRGYRLSLRYAQERVQGRAIGQRGGKPTAIVNHPDVKRMLLQQKVYAEGALALCLYCAKLVDEEHDAESTALLGLLTPVAKTWPSEYGLAANDLAIQIHGGYGYTRDFDVEQLYRDNRLNSIHEGTTGIQAIDLLGRKILRDSGEGLAAARKRVLACVARAEADSALTSHACTLKTAWDKIEATIETLRGADPGLAFDNATPFLQAFGHTIVGWLWLEQALGASGDTPLHHGKHMACRFFMECELPKIGPWLSIVASLTDVAASADPDYF